MSTRPTASKTLTRAAPKQAVPRWLVYSLAAVLCVLIYGMIRPKPPNAFDLPEAQRPIRTLSPWETVR